MERFSKRNPKGLPVFPSTKFAVKVRGDEARCE
jgi:hypothetical protein